MADRRLSKIPTLGACPVDYQPMENFQRLSCPSSPGGAQAERLVSGNSLGLTTSLGPSRAASMDENAAPLSEVYPENLVRGAAPDGTFAKQPGKLCTALLCEFQQDPNYRNMIHSFLNRQLTRTKDGATDQSRIAELCDMVKTGRRAIRLTEAKLEGIQTFLANADTEWAEAKHRQEACILLKEKEVQLEQEILRRERAANHAADEHQKCLSQIKADKDAEIDVLQAEVRRLKSVEASASASEQKDADGNRAALQEEILRQKLQMKNLEFEMAHNDVVHKKDIEKLQGRINNGEAELNRLKRELMAEREQVASLTFSHKQAVAAQQRAEEELERLKQRSTQELTQVQANKGELWQTLMQTRTEAAKEADCLREQLAKVTERADAAESRGDILEAERALWSADNSASASRLAELDKEITGLQDKLLLAQKEGSQLSDNASAALAAVRRLECESSTMQERCEASDMRARELQEAVDEARTAQCAATDRCVKLEAALAAAKCELEDAKQQRSRLKAALARMAASRDELEQALHRTQSEHDETLAQLSSLKHDSTQLQAQFKAAATQLQQADTNLRQAREEATEASDRLAAMEGQMEALQGVVGCGDQAQAVSQLVSRVGRLEVTLAEAEKVRRKLHNDLMEIRGNIRVFCRLRPCRGTAAAEPLAADAVRLIVDGKANDFYFDRVLSARTSQDEVFSAVSDVVQSALDGYQVCLFSYGQTGSGKTHTMNGAPSSVHERGIIPRAIQAILEQAGRLAPAGWQFKLEAMYIEIYNETLRDLLAEPAGAAPGARSGLLDSNAIKHDPGSHTQVLGANRVLVETEACAQAVVERAARARATDATAMNATSSRSHSIFVLQITGTHEESGTTLVGSLNLVDLAGSERLARSQAEGQRQKETCAINKSLSSLGDIFQALASRSPHVPYRNSKLTYLLQPCLGGDGKTLMFVNINPEQESAYESLCALRFASKVNAVETAARGGARRHVTSCEHATPTKRRDSLLPVQQHPGRPRRSLSASNIHSHCPSQRRPTTLPRLPAPGVPKRPATGSKVDPHTTSPGRCLSVPAAKRRK